MAVLAGPFIASAALLGAAGALKVARPATTARALRAVGVPGSATAVRVGAAVEVGVAGGAILAGSPPFAAAVALSYLGFAAFVLVALRRGVPLSSCGCFGGQDTPPTYGHLAFDLAAAAVALAVVLHPHGVGLLHGALDGSFVVRALFVLLTAAAAWFGYVVLTLLPQVLGAGKAAA